MGLRAEKAGISNIIAALILVSLVVAGVGIYYIVLSGYIKPQPNMSLSFSITKEASGFVTIYGTITNTGNVPIKSVTVRITDSLSNPNPLIISCSTTISANGGSLNIAVNNGGPGGAFTLISGQGCSNPSGSINPQYGTSNTVLVTATLSNGGTFSQALNVPTST